MGILLRNKYVSLSLIKTFLNQSRTTHTLNETVHPTHKNITLDIKINKDTIAKLEKISLVDFDNEGGIRRLESAIRFAQKLVDLKVDETVKPMYSVLEEEILQLREDKVTEGNCRAKILKNAKVLEDEYFVAPPDNIPRSS